MIRLLTLAVIVAFPVYGSAEGLVSPNEFEAMSQNRTQYFERGGVFYGAEQFFPDRTSLWQYRDGSCTWGKWYAEGDRICFIYEASPGPQCWHFSKRDGSFFARIAGLAEGDPSELKLSKSDGEPLPCPAPDTGA